MVEESCVLTAPTPEGAYSMGVVVHDELRLATDEEGAVCVRPHGSVVGPGRGGRHTPWWTLPTVTVKVGWIVLYATSRSVAAVNLRTFPRTAKDALETLPTLYSTRPSMVLERAQSAVTTLV